MIRDIRIIVVAAFVLFNVAPLMAQNEGVVPFSDNATRYIFQDPEPWSGARYSTPHSFVERLYFVGGVGLSQIWRYDRELDSSDGGLGSRLGFGVKLAPVHSIEVGTTFNNLNRIDDYHNSLDLSYLFNLSGYGERTESTLPFDIQLRGGVEYCFEEYSSVHILSGLRLRYNFPVGIGLFLEPGIGACIYSEDASHYAIGDVRSSVMFGLSVNIGDITTSRSRDVRDRDYYLYNKSALGGVPLLSVKSNMLYDIALVPNLEFEISIKDNWSIGVQAMCGWWLNSDNSRCWQVQAADLEGRYWLGDRLRYRALSGWFVGLFASAGFYDFQIDDTKGMQGEFYVMTGFSGGYSMPIGRRMNLEFAAGVGYIINDYQKYTVYENKYLVADGPAMRFQSIFPAKLEVSLGWLLFKGGRNKMEKGGRS